MTRRSENNGLATRPPLNPDPETMRRIGYQLIDHVVDHLASLSEQPVAKRGTQAEYARLLDEPLPLEGAELGDCMQFLLQRVIPGMTRVNHPRFHGFIPCPSSFAGAIGEMMTAGVNPFTGSWLGGATFSELELTTIRWITDLLGFPNTAGGIFTSGGSMANLIGLAAARSWASGDSDHGDILRQGVIYLSSEGHASVNKAAAILGFAPANIRTIEVDQDFRIRVDLLRQRMEDDRKRGLRPFFLAANAGATNTGAIDPLPQLNDLCRQQRMWFHVDGAYGGFAAIAEQGRKQLAGMEEADSLTLDPHKWLYCPMGIGCALVRDPLLMERAFSSNAGYLQDLPDDEVNFLNRGPELSRPARVTPVWMVIRSTGRARLAEQIEHDLRLAQLAADLLREDARFDVIGPNLSVVNFRHRTLNNESETQRANRDIRLMEATLESGELMLSTTTIGGLSTLRFVVMNHLTTEVEVRRSVSAIRRESNAS